MKVLVFLALILFAANCGYTLWDNWHNVPTTWQPYQPGTISSVSHLSGWIRNGPNSQHPSGRFNNYTNIFTQYLYWNSEDSNIVIICGPKYYLYDDYRCKVDPYYKTPNMPTYCQPNYFNYPDMPNTCESSYAFSPDAPCCYDGGSFEKTISSKDLVYSTPLW